MEMRALHQAVEALHEELAWLERYQRGRMREIETLMEEIYGMDDKAFVKECSEIFSAETLAETAQEPPVVQRGKRTLMLYKFHTKGADAISEKQRTLASIILWLEKYSQKLPTEF